MSTFGHYIFLLEFHLSLNLAFTKISPIKLTNKLKIISITLSAIILLILHVNLSYPLPIKVAFTSLFYTFLYTSLLHIEFYNSFVIVLVSTTLSFFYSMLSIILTAGFIMITKFDYTNPFTFIIYFLLQSIFLFSTFKIKRFKNGFPFLCNQNKNFYITNFVLILSIIVVITYFFITRPKNISTSSLIIYFILLIIIFIILIQQNFILYQKQKLQTKTLKEYEHELQETKQKLSTAISEKANLVKSNHEFYHRQKAIERKLDLLLLKTTNNSNVEFGEDYGDILERLKQLSKEYNAKTQIIPKLPKTNITEIDDMLSYMQSECLANNIEFILKIECDINYLLDKFINKNDLETLLGDLIRNAIIAINHSNNDFRSIMVIFGIKDDIYELCILDSGIPFEINTLVNLGLAPASTHLDEGGTGIGFITTFETLNKYSASIIINELLDNNYSKSIEIKFDKSLNYTVISNRIDEIEKCNNEKRKIILKSDTAKC